MELIQVAQIFSKVPISYVGYRGRSIWLYFCMCHERDWCMKPKLFSQGQSKVEVIVKNWAKVKRKFNVI